MPNIVMSLTKIVRGQFLCCQISPRFSSVDHPKFQSFCHTLVDVSSLVMIRNSVKNMPSCRSSSRHAVSRLQPVLAACCIWKIPKIEHVETTLSPHSLIEDGLLFLTEFLRRVAHSSLGRMLAGTFLSNCYGKYFWSSKRTLFARADACYPMTFLPAVYS